MHIEKFRHYCLSKAEVTEDFPFNEDTLVFKVAGKMFALTNLAGEEFRVNLKCDPQRAIELRERYPQEIIPGYHMNKKHWNTVYFERDLPNDLLKELTEHSYQLVVGSLPRKIRDQIQTK